MLQGLISLKDERYSLSCNLYTPYVCACECVCVITVGLSCAAHLRISFAAGLKPPQGLECFVCTMRCINTNLCFTQ